MELVYFWVRDYKNIENQGFNFSGKWEFGYKEDLDGKNGIITYKDLENPTPDGFFGENIVNVTGIVGKNGSGKSSLINAILESPKPEISINSFKVFFEGALTKKSGFRVYINNNLGGFWSMGQGGLKISQNDMSYEDNLELDHRNIAIKKLIYDQNILYRSNLSDFKSNNAVDSSFIDLTLNTIFRKYLYNKQITINSNIISIFESRQMLDQISFANEFYQKTNLQTTFINNQAHSESVLDFIPEHLYISLISNKNIQATTTRIDIEDRYFDYKNEILTEIEAIQNKLTFFRNSNTKSHRKYLSVLLQEIILNQFHIKMTIQLRLLGETNYAIIPELKKAITYLSKINKALTVDIFAKQLFSDLINLYVKLSENKIWNHRFANILEVKNNLLKLSVEFNKLTKFYKSDEESIKVNKDNKVLRNFLDSYSKSLNWLENEIILISWDKTLSDGEKSLLNIFSRLTIYKNKIREIGSNNFDYICLFLDEPDLNFHPEWQRQLLTYLLGFFKDYDDRKIDDDKPLFKNKKIQIILTTHSPYILSDLPKNNVIVMEDGKISHKLAVEHSKTFGANIHELLSSDFFMQNTIGEFAYQKIKEVIELIQDNTTEGREKEIDFIIENIGEPIIANKLKSMYLDLKFKDEIQRLKYERKAIDEKITKLKNK